MYYKIMSVFISIYMSVASLFYTPTPVTPVNPGRVPEPASTLKATVMTYNLKTSGLKNSNNFFNELNQKLETIAN